MLTWKTLKAEGRRWIRFTEQKKSLHILKQTLGHHNMIRNPGMGRVATKSSACFEFRVKTRILLNSVQGMTGSTLDSCLYSPTTPSCSALSVAPPIPCLESMEALEMVSYSHKKWQLKQGAKGAWISSSNMVQSSSDLPRIIILANYYY